MSPIPGSASSVIVPSPRSRITRRIEARRARFDYVDRRTAQPSESTGGSCRCGERRRPGRSFDASHPRPRGAASTRPSVRWSLWEVARGRHGPAPRVIGSEWTSRRWWRPMRRRPPRRGHDDGVGHASCGGPPGAPGSTRAPLRRLPRPAPARAPRSRAARALRARRAAGPASRRGSGTCRSAWAPRRRRRGAPRRAPHPAGPS